MTNNELTLDQLQTIAGGMIFAKIEGIKGGVECKVPPSVEDVILAPLGGEDVFSEGDAKSIVHPQYRLSGSAGPGGTSF